MNKGQFRLIVADITQESNGLVFATRGEFNDWFANRLYDRLGLLELTKELDKPTPQTQFPNKRRGYEWL